ncbi:MAG: roadblock/LC7 domain-containing protein [Lentisphaeraceae bacterium]|nr:roadblock/LC7 domain-containing protein [Lentisphaeraceae bacterium]
MAFELNVTDCERIQKDLNEFLDLSEAQATLLCDRGGSILFSEGEFQEDAIDLICALVAGSFAATKELALALGEDEFSAIFHQGQNNSIFISAIGEEVLLLSIFSENTNAGLVKMYAKTACRKMQGLFAEIGDRSHVEAEDVTASFVIKKENLFE